MPQFVLSNRALHALATPAMPLTGAFYGQLMTSSFTFNRDTHDTMAAITSGEISPITGYSAGGKAVTLANSMNNTTGVNTLTIAPVTWVANVTGVRGILYYYRPSSTPADQIVLGYNNIGSNQDHYGGQFRIAEAKIDTAQLSGSPITLPYATVNAIINETLNLSAGNFWAMLLGSGYTPNPLHSFRSDLTSEVTGTGYTAGGVAAPLTITRNDATDIITVRAEQIIHPAWTSTIHPRHVAYYQKLGGAASADRLVMVANYGANYPATGGVYPINANEIQIAGYYP
jgi:hypothetical protein